MSHRRRLAVPVVLGLLLAACSLDDDSAERADESARDTADRPDERGGGGADPTAVLDDVPCDADGLGEDSEALFVAAHYVVGGDLGALCFGRADATLTQAWTELTTITPEPYLDDLALFAGFVGDGRSEDASLAFVNAVDDAGTQFQMSVDLDAYDADPDEGLLTLAHELAHVFAAVPSELDRTVEPDECPTYDNGEGCLRSNSLLLRWIERFWTPEQLAGVDSEAEVTAEDGEERCALDAGFFGPYAASTPDEDFAESFAAFVFRVPADTPAQQARLDWFAADPGLAEFRDRATAAGRGPLDNDFEACGLDA